MASPTLSEVNFKKSLMQFFEDQAFPVKVFFDDLSDIPVDDLGVKLDKWIIVAGILPRKVDILKTKVLFTICTTKDSEYFKQSRIYDDFTELFTDDTNTNGLRTIPFYETRTTPFVLIGGLMAMVDTTTTIFETDSKVACRGLSYDFVIGY